MLIAGVVPLILLAFAFPAAQATPPAAAPEVPPVVWELVALTGADGAQIEIADPSRYTVQFLPEGRLGAKLDCNQGSAGYTASDGVVEIMDMVSTLALCEPESLGETFQDTLAQATSFEFDADGFLRLRGNEGALRLRASLAGVLWEWQEFAGSDGEVVRPDDPSHYTVEFLPEGRLAIRADCNRATGTYSVDGPIIDLRVDGVTRALCPPGSLMDRYLRDLDEVNSHVFREGRLYLALPFDSGILMFAPREIEPLAATPVAG